MPGQVGLEGTPDEYVAKMVAIFDQVRRVLKHDGTLWLNLGDTYNAYKAGTGDSPFARFSGRPVQHRGLLAGGLKVKDLVGIPWMAAFALRQPHFQCGGCGAVSHGSKWGHFPNGRLICPACGESKGETVHRAGWYLRQDLIWHKPNPMPESVRDRCTKSHEYLFLLTKSSRYYFNQLAIKEPIRETSVQRYLQDVEHQQGSYRVPGKTNGPMKARLSAEGRQPRPGIDKNGGNQAKGHIPMSGDGTGIKGHSGYFKANGALTGGGMANKRSVWTVATHPFKQSHFATFPEILIVDCIKAGSREGDIVLDPFTGSGTTAVVAACLNRRYVGFELNPAYVAMARKRLKKRLGLFYHGP
jgi:DNA modification methylase